MDDDEYFVDAVAADDPGAVNYSEDLWYSDDESVSPYQRPRQPIVIGANWRRRTHHTYDYIHEMRENYYRPMTDYLDRRAGDHYRTARQPAARSFAERSCSYHQRERPLPQALRERRSPPPFYQSSTFSDDVLQAMGVRVPKYNLLDMSEDPIINKQLQPHKCNNHVPTTTDKILMALGVRPRDFAELPDQVEPTLTHVENDPNYQDPTLTRILGE